MTPDEPFLDEWVVVMEFLTPGGAAVDHRALYAVVQDLRGWQATALSATDRYALQLRLTAAGPSDAMQLALEMHRRAVETVGVDESALVRSEVITAVEFERQVDELDVRVTAPARFETVLSESIYGATRAMIEATTASELTDILVGFVGSVGAEVKPGPVTPPPGHITIDISLEDGEARHAVVDALSVSRMVLERALPNLLEDARAVLARRRQPHSCHRPPA